jgi:type IV fimbrial biogenesis protein FimT
MRIEKAQSGFTIVELMMTLVVAGIILAIAVPAFRDFVANNRLTAATNTLIASISYARSEAVRQSRIVRIVSPDDDWAGGWTILDQNGDTLRTFDAMAGDVTMEATTTTLQFDGRGLLIGGAATFTVCDGRANERGRQIQVSATGRPELNREYGDCNS